MLKAFTFVSKYISKFDSDYIILNMQKQDQQNYFQALSDVYMDSAVHYMNR